MSENKLLYKKMSLEELVVLSQKDDFKALGELIKKIQKEVYATLAYFAKNDENIHDLTQDVLLKVAKNIHSLKRPKCFKSWLNQIITNTYYDSLRKNKNTPELIYLDCNESSSDFSLKIEICDNKGKPIEKCITTECENMIKSAIRQLPEPFKIAIILREFQGLSYDEIAKTTNTSVGTVKSRIARARIKLQEVLKNYI